MEVVSSQGEFRDRYDPRSAESLESLDQRRFGMDENIVIQISPRDDCQIVKLERKR